jgi:propionyl-CoA carboxylase alpha chain
MDIPIYYDPMIAKLITHGKDREEAIERMIRAIDEYRISGLQTTLAFCKFVMQHEEFRGGAFDTKFVQNYFKPEMLNEKLTDEELFAAAKFAAFVTDKKQSNGKTKPENTNSEVAKVSAWRSRMKN